MHAEDEEADHTMATGWSELLAACRRAVRLVAADRPAEGNEIFVYTVFQAKGQQWRHVYLAVAFASGFRDAHGLGEGARLLYVAVTRAQRSLTITKPNRAAPRSALAASLGTLSPVFPPNLVESARVAGVQLEVLGAQP